MSRQLGVVLFVAAIALIGCEKGKKNVELKTDEQKASYAIGQQIGNSLKTDGVQLDPDIIGASIGDVLTSQKARLSAEEMGNAMQALRTKMMAKQQEAGKENKTKGTAFLEENKKKPNVKTTASGLQYEVVTEGAGSSPKDTDQVKVNYKGTLLDGSEFDSSYKRNQPAVFPVMGVIPGWSEALRIMKPGSKYKLTIPSELAYGEAGRPGIPPNSVLNFEVELIEIVKAEAPPAAPAAAGKTPAPDTKKSAKKGK